MFQRWQCVQTFPQGIMPHNRSHLIFFSARSRWCSFVSSSGRKQRGRWFFLEPGVFATAAVSLWGSPSDLLRSAPLTLCYCTLPKSRDALCDLHFALERSIFPASATVLVVVVVLHLVVARARYPDVKPPFVISRVKRMPGKPLRGSHPLYISLPVPPQELPCVP